MRILGFVSIAVLFAVQGSHQLMGQTSVNLVNFTGTSVAKAAPDECWVSLGQNTKYDFPPCSAGKTLKVNQAYVWSLAEAGDFIWFGTTANPICTTAGEAAGNLNTNPYQTQAWACEFNKSPYSPNPYSGVLGDLRPPQIYMYNKTTRALTNITPTGPINRNNPLGIDPDVIQTLGFRAVAVVGDHIIFGGPNTKSGLNLFAFRVSDGAWVAKTSYGTYSNMRHLTSLNGITYAAVKTNNGGALLRYTGTIPDSIVPAPRNQAPPTCSTCFTFSQVTAFDNEAAEVTVHNGRVYVGTWTTSVLNHVAATASVS